jgi:MoaA/NifB/PqqE/SkfB family radical SAM enzyme
MHRALRHLPSVLSRKRPVHLTFFVTRRCNADCPFCFYQGARRREDGAPELSRDEIARVARSLDALLWVLFSGGEPFLREDLAGISQVFHDTNRAAFLTFPTNGLLPDAVAETTEEILRRCPDSVVVVKPSLDGIGAEHDTLRRTPGGFDRLMRTVQALAALARRFPRLELGINTLFCSANQWRMPEIVEFVRGLDGVRSHTLTLVRAGASDASFQEVDLDQYRRASRMLELRWSAGPSRSHRFAGGRLKAAQDRLQRELIHRTLTSRRRLTPCYAGRLNLVLTESGDLFPCEGRWDRSFGNVREAAYDVAGMLRSGRAREIQDEMAGGPCYCSHECNTLTNILFNPRMHPRLLRDWAWMGLGLQGWGSGSAEDAATASMAKGTSRQEVVQ